MDIGIEYCPAGASADEDASAIARFDGATGDRAGLGGVVPYITAWSGERGSNVRMIARGAVGIGFTDETLVDRDERGVLWTRAASRPGVGRPEYRRVHALRQRRAMRRLLCQVCGRPADRDERGVLWLLRDHQQDWPGWPEGIANTYPPVCLPCARRSVGVCPALRRGYVAVRARRFPLTGVFGLRYRPGDLGTIGAVVVGYDDPVIRWTRATQQVRSLYECTLDVDLSSGGAA